MERPRTEKLRMEIGEADRGEAGNEGAERGEAGTGPLVMKSRDQRRGWERRGREGKGKEWRG